MARTHPTKERSKTNDINNLHFLENINKFWKEIMAKKHVNKCCFLKIQCY